MEKGPDQHEVRGGGEQCSSVAMVMGSQTTIHRSSLFWPTGLGEQ